MNITNILLAAILIILVKQFYPATADTLVAVGVFGLVAYSAYWLLAKFPAQWKKRRAEKVQRESDEKEFWEYRKVHDAIRAKYDPRNEWNEATSVPREYLEEIRELNLAHCYMLQRRNGWTIEDFDE